MKETRGPRWRLNRLSVCLETIFVFPLLCSSVCACVSGWNWMLPSFAGLLSAMPFRLTLVFARFVFFGPAAGGAIFWLKKKTKVTRSAVDVRLCPNDEHVYLERTIVSVFYQFRSSTHSHTHTHTPSHANDSLMRWIIFIYTPVRSCN